MTELDTGAPQEPGFDASSTNSVLAGITPLVEGVGASLIADALTLGGGLQGVDAAPPKIPEELDTGIDAFLEDWGIHGVGIEHA